MFVDYKSVMGVEDLAEKAGKGRAVTVAVLDSGYPKPSCLPAARCIGSGDTDDEFGHATSVASIIFGGCGIGGVCEGGRPLYVKVLDDHGNGSVKSVVRGIYDAIEYGADIINLSLGFMRTEKCPKDLEKACASAYEAGKAIVCAAGNDGGPVNWPAALDTTICVGSSGGNGLKTSFSSVGEVDFVAPGANLRVLDKNSRLSVVSGTSFSAALVTGVAALLYRVDESISDVESLKKALRDMAEDVSDPGWDKNTGYGLISGRKRDSTVCLYIKSGIFDRISDVFRRIFCLNAKENVNGRV